MSELKEYLFCECDTYIREYKGQLSNEIRPFYLKSEVDKVIAHNKYKRCLDKAKICQLRIERYERYLSKRRDCDGLLNNKRWQFLKTHYEKWYECWLELAEKFKEVK